MHTCTHYLYILLRFHLLLLMQGFTPMHHVAGVQSSLLNHGYYKLLCEVTIKELLLAGADINAADSQVLLCLLMKQVNVCQQP